MHEKERETKGSRRHELKTNWRALIALVGFVAFFIVTFQLGWWPERHAWISCPTLPETEESEASRFILPVCGPRPIPEEVLEPEADVMFEELDGKLSGGLGCGEGAVFDEFELAGFRVDD